MICPASRKESQAPKQKALAKTSGGRSQQEASLIIPTISSRTDPHKSQAICNQSEFANVLPKTLLLATKQNQITLRVLKKQASKLFPQCSPLLKNSFSISNKCTISKCTGSQAVLLITQIAITKTILICKTQCLWFSNKLTAMERVKICLPLMKLWIQTKVESTRADSRTSEAT